MSTDQEKIDLVKGLLERAFDEWDKVHDKVIDKYEERVMNTKLLLYLAAPWIDKDKMGELAAKFEAKGHSITHKWWLVEDGLARTLETLREQAQWDFDGVVAADVVVLFNTSKSEGKAVEQGIALGLGKPIVAVGKQGEISKNVFHYLSDYTWVDDVDGALEVLERELDGEAN